MVTDRLKAVVKRIEQLPPEEQERLLQQIEDTLDDAQWLRYWPLPALAWRAMR